MRLRRHVPCRRDDERAAARNAVGIALDRVLVLAGLRAEAERASRIDLPAAPRSVVVTDTGRVRWLTKTISFGAATVTMLGETLASRISTRAPGFQSQPTVSFAPGGAVKIVPAPLAAGCQSGSEPSTVAAVCWFRVTRRTKPARSVTQRSAPDVNAIVAPSGDQAGRAAPLSGGATVYVT